MARAKRKTSKARTPRTTSNRRRHKPEPVSVAPIAVQTSEPHEALIPAVVKQTPQSTEAVIEVEVKRGSKVRRRAAVIPIAVRQRAAEQAETSRQQRRSEERDEEWRRKHPVQWSDPLTDSVIFATRVAEKAIHFAHDLGTTVIASWGAISRLLFSRARVVASAAERKRFRQLDFPTVIENPRRAEIEVRAA